MPHYNFDALNDKELEELVRDLLQKHLQIQLESFKKGRDKGVDLRYSSEGTENAIIVQVKHYYKSGFSKLYGVLKDEELKKVKALIPKRYILATSLELGVNDKEKIKTLFEPYILTTSDILGNDDLNALLNQYPEVFKAHFKLYLSSIHILNKILTHHIHSRSNFKIEEIQKRIKLFVQNKAYKDSIEILNREKFLIITGEPGIGKTTLAEFICYQHLADGFKFTYILNSLTDAERILEDDERQIFYFDDFLGANYLKIKHEPHHDTSLINFINRIKGSRNKRMILTSRTTILNQAKADYEQLNAPMLDIARHEIVIQDYNEYDKALILYNHLFHSSISNEYVEKIVQDKNYRKIISHKNYSPRIINYITDPLRLGTIRSEDYQHFILAKLDKPDDIWKQPYENQISESAQFFLQTMFTFDLPVSESILIDAFNDRLNYEVKENGFRKSSNVFQRTVYELLGGYINRRQGRDEFLYDFYNPSFGDFMLNLLRGNPEEINRILKGSFYVSQFKKSFSSQKRRNDYHIFSFIGIQQPIFLSEESLFCVVQPKIEKLKGFEKFPAKELAIISFLLDNFSFSIVEDELFILYNKIDLEQISAMQYSQLLSLTEILHHPNSKVCRKVLSEWETIILKLFSFASSKSHFEKIRELFDDYELNYNEFSLKYYDELQNFVDDFWKYGGVDDLLETEDFTDLTEVRDVMSQLAELQDEVNKMNDLLNLAPSPSFDKISSVDYEAIVEKNLQKETEEEYEADVTSTSDEENESNIDYSSKIDALFGDMIRD
jgi:hypothetical protein